MCRPPPAFAPTAASGRLLRPRPRRRSLRFPPRRRSIADDGELVAALRRGEARARSILVERYEPLVERLVAGALGIDAEIADVVQDVFVAVLEGVRNLKDASALRSWIATLTVFTARGRIRRRRRWRWIRFVAPEEVPEVPVAGPQGETHEAVRATYAHPGDFPGRRTPGVYSALHLGDAAYRGGRGLPGVAGDRQAPAGTCREAVRRSGARASGAE